MIHTQTLGGAKPHVFVIVLCCALASISSACHDPFSPIDAVSGAVVFSPPPEYQRWWVDVENCSGLTGDYNRVSWYVLPDATTFRYRGQDDNGYWWSTHDILIAGASLSDSLVVRHEMLHDILNTGDHPDEYFLYKCWGVVAYGADG